MAAAVWAAAVAVAIERHESMNRNGIILLIVLLLAGPLAHGEMPTSPFAVTSAWTQYDGQDMVRVTFDMPPDHALYFDRLHFQNEQGEELPVYDIDAPVLGVDKVTGQEKRFYNHQFSALLKLKKRHGMELVVKFQGCSNTACYFPDKRFFTVTPDAITATPSEPVAEPVAMSTTAPAVPEQAWRQEAGKFKEVARGTGYVRPREFISFLNQGVTGMVEASNDPLGYFKRLGLLATFLLIVGGGLGLNLTPCVLPLIPINLAVIGAGSAAQSRKRGFVFGGIYGAGMALAYGVLGLFVVLTGAKFGTLNSTIWFNVGVAVVFAVLSLGMFDVLSLDFSKYDNGLGNTIRGTGSRWLVAFGLGIVSALLAGACVAPVVISVLLLATNLYGKGVVLGLALPFLLGLGMALPWPFLGAGLTLLPKPGQWMVWVKYGFGILILGFSVYYLSLAYGLFQSKHPSTQLASAPGDANMVSGANQSLALALEAARKNGRPVLVDFQASWCKNCAAMDETVFNQDAVQRRLKDFVVVKYQAERPNESPAREVLDHFNVLGLPTYLVLLPEKL